MFKRFLILTILMASFLMSACGGEAQTPSGQAPAPETVARPPATPSDSLLRPTGESPHEQPSSGQFTSECTLASSVPEPPAEYVEKFGPTKTDWSLGPEDATITIVEYGDFQ